MRRNRPHGHIALLGKGRLAVIEATMKPTDGGWWVTFDGKRGTTHKDLADAIRSIEEKMFRRQQDKGDIACVPDKRSCPGGRVGKKYACATGQ
ncbi:MAG: hypothetical protein AAB360_01910 [Patescibacteria group bacterium]